MSSRLICPHTSTFFTRIGNTLNISLSRTYLLSCALSKTVRHLKKGLLWRSRKTCRSPKHLILANYFQKKVCLEPWFVKLLKDFWVTQFPYYTHRNYSVTDDEKTRFCSEKYNKSHVTFRISFEQSILTCREISTYFVQ